MKNFTSFITAGLIVLLYMLIYPDSIYENNAFITLIIYGLLWHMFNMYFEPCDPVQDHEITDAELKLPWFTKSNQFKIDRKDESEDYTIENIK